MNIGKPKKTYSKEELIEILKDFNEKTGLIPKRKDIPQSVNLACVEVFGDWHTAIIEIFGINAVQSKKIRKEHGLCIICGTVPEVQGKWYCKKCMEQRNIQKNKLRERRIENRQCPYCGDKLEENDKKYCKKCLKSTNDSHKRKKEENKQIKFEIKELLQDILNNQVNLKEDIKHKIENILDKLEVE